MELAEHYHPEKPICVDRIAARTGVPAKFLAQILPELKAAGLVNSTRGPAGGYWLMRRPEIISVAEVVAAVKSVASSNSEGPECDDPRRKAISELADEVERTRLSMLRHVTLADFVQRAKSYQ